MDFNEAMAWTIGSILSCGLILPVLFGRIIYLWLKPKNSPH